MNVRRRAIIGRRRGAAGSAGEGHAAVVALANAVRGWDPNQPDASAFDPASLEVEDADVAVLARALHALASRLEDFGERERNFTRDASHELRTPLTVIKVAADVLADEENLSNFARRSIGRIRNSVREIEALIEAFLVLARESDTGLPEEDFLVNDVVREEVDRYRDLLGAKPVQLELDEQARFALHAPPRVFAVVIGNLLRNACLYTERGSIVVGIHEGEIRVTDTGCGMGEEDLARAFQTFYKGSRTGAQGHGIGLAVVRRIADRFRWPVALESAPGRGTVATLRFPKAMAVSSALPRNGQGTSE
jgi:signal transduction histidine kinase